MAAPARCSLEVKHLRVNQSVVILVAHRIAVEKFSEFLADHGITPPLTVVKVP